jgi:hypothetical protein
VNSTAEAVQPTGRMTGGRARPNSATRAKAARRGIATPYEPLVGQETDSGERR